MDVWVRVFTSVTGRHRLILNWVMERGEKYQIGTDGTPHKYLSELSESGRKQE